jgi:hypothetical protein
MSEMLVVSPAQLRAAASTLDGIRDGLLDGGPPPGPGDPAWAATEALGALLALVHDGLAGLARRCADTAVALRVAADAYDDADERAVRRAADGPAGEPSW